MGIFICYMEINISCLVELKIIVNIVISIIANLNYLIYVVTCTTKQFDAIKFTKEILYQFKVCSCKHFSAEKYK